MNLQNSTCIITGAARGIGLALCEALYERGANLVLTDLDAPALEASAQKFDSARVQAVQADIRKPEEVNRVGEAAQSWFGGIDVWINNAGLAKHMPIVDYSEADMDLMMDVNLKGTVLGCQAALRAMIPARKGHIINIISTASLRGIPEESFYCATKWAVRGFTKALQEEAAPHNIRVTALLPGGVDTAFWDQANDRDMPVQDFLSATQVALATCSALEQDDNVVIRELVVRSIKDRDFAQSEEA